MLNFLKNCKKYVFWISGYIFTYIIDQLTIVVLKLKKDHSIKKNQFSKKLNLFLKQKQYKSKVIKNILNSYSRTNRFDIFREPTVNPTTQGIFFDIKNLFNTFFNQTVIYFFRKNKIYIKSKFPKIRAFNKTIVLFSLCINIIFIIELHSLYYNITLNYGYFIYYVYIVIVALNIKFILKYRLYRLNYFFYFFFKSTKFFIKYFFFKKKYI